MRLTMRKAKTHKRRIEAFAHTPVEEKPHVFRWSPAQQRAGQRIFLRRKWFYDADEIRAYGVNIRLGNRNHPARWTFAERSHGHQMKGR